MNTGAVRHRGLGQLRHDLAGLAIQQLFLSGRVVRIAPIPVDQHVSHGHGEAVLNLLLTGQGCLVFQTYILMLYRQFHGSAHQFIQAGIVLRSGIDGGDAFLQSGDLRENVRLFRFVRGFGILFAQALDAQFLGFHGDLPAADLCRGLLQKLHDVIDGFTDGPARLASVCAVRENQRDLVLVALNGVRFCRVAAENGSGEMIAVKYIQHVVDLPPQFIQLVFQLEQVGDCRAAGGFGSRDIPKVIRKRLLMHWRENAQAAKVVEVQQVWQTCGIDVVDPHIAVVAVFTLHIQPRDDIGGVFLTLYAVQVLAEVQFHHGIVSVQRHDCDGLVVAIEDRAGIEQLADVGDQQVRPTLVLGFQGAHLLRHAVRLIERLAVFERPAGVLERLFQEVPRSADAVGIVEGEEEVLLGEQGTDVLTGDRR